MLKLSMITVSGKKCLLCFLSSWFILSPHHSFYSNLYILRLKCGSNSEKGKIS